MLDRITPLPLEPVVPAEHTPEKGLTESPLFLLPYPRLVEVLAGTAQVRQIMLVIMEALVVVEVFKHLMEQQGLRAELEHQTKDLLAEQAELTTATFLLAEAAEAQVKLEQMVLVVLLVTGVMAYLSALLELQLTTLAVLAEVFTPVLLELAA